MRHIVGSQEIADLEASIKEHGGQNVYWLSDSTNERLALKAGLPRNHLLSIQNLISMENTLELFGEGWEECSCYNKPAPKPKSKKSAKKAEE